MKKSFTLRVIMAVIAIGSCAVLSAQTVIKVGAGQGKNQTTIQLAYDSIVPATLEGAYVIEIQSDYDPATEVYPISLKAKTGASSVNAITIRPASGVKKILACPNKTVIYSNLAFTSGVNILTLPSVTGITAGMAVYGVGLNVLSTPYRYYTVASVDANANTITMSDATVAASTADKKTFVGTPGTQTIAFNGAKYITIDGVSRTGATGLEIQNPNSINAQTIYFYNNAMYNTIQNCTVRGANISGNINNGFQGTIYFMGGQYNTITNNDVCDMNDPNIPYPICAFQMTAAGGSNNNNTVTNNNVYNISNFYSANGTFTFMQFGSESTSANNVVLNNRFYWTAPVSMGGIIPINIGTLSTGNRFENNVIGYGAADGTGTSTITSTGAFGTGNGIRWMTCKNNTVGGINFTGTAFRGLWISTINNTYAADDICNGNTVKDIVFTATAAATMEGIYITSSNAGDMNIKNNKVQNLNMISTSATNVCTAYGMRSSGTVNNIYNYSGNVISDISAGDLNSTAANVAYGLYVQSTNAVSVDRNLVYNIYANGTGAAVIRGIQTVGSNVLGTLFANNIVRLGTFATNDASIIAFYQGNATTALDPCSIYNNTFYIGGNAPSTATKSTYAFFKQSGNALKADLQNNIFANKRVTGAAESHYAMQINAATDLYLSDYNLFQFSTNLAYVAGTINAVAPDLSIWQSLNLDMHSISADPKFVSPESLIPDLRLQAASPAKAAGTNLLTFVPKDFNGFTRTANDIGALAYGTLSAVPAVGEMKLSVYTLNNGIVINNEMGKTAEIYSVSGQLIKSSLLTSDCESITLNKGFYIVRVGNLTNKVLVK